MTTETESVHSLPNKNSFTLTIYHYEVGLILILFNLFKLIFPIPFLHKHTLYYYLDINESESSFSKFIWINLTLQNKRMLMNDVGRTTVRRIYCKNYEFTLGLL